MRSTKEASPLATDSAHWLFWRGHLGSLQARGPRAGSFDVRLPLSDILHRGPGLLLRLGAPLLQQLDRNVVGRADEGHVAVPRRAVDGDAVLHQPLAGRVNIVDLESEVPEVPPFAVRLWIPIIRELDLGVLVAWRSKIVERVAPVRILRAPHFLEPELVAIEIERLVDVANAHHGVEILHDKPLTACVSTPDHPLAWDVCCDKLATKQGAHGAFNADSRPIVARRPQV
jgi:hypothetical protein